MIEVEYSVQVVVAVVHRGRFGWYISEVEDWVLNPEDSVDQEAVQSALRHAKELEEDQVTTAEMRLTSRPAGVRGRARRDSGAPSFALRELRQADVVQLVV